jgi:hypothetical protein
VHTILQGKIRSIPLLSVSRIVQGQTTPVFKRDRLPEYEAVSFSLLYSEGGRGSSGGKERSLDVVCRTTQEFETWSVDPGGLGGGVPEEQNKPHTQLTAEYSAQLSAQGMGGGVMMQGVSHAA